MENIDLVKSLVALGGVPLIIGLVQMVKLWVADTRLYPVFAVAFGLLINLGATWFLGAITGLDWFAAFWMGILAGLAASGLYSGATTTKPT